MCWKTVKGWKTSNTFLLMIVIVALIIDGSLVSVIVPILPDYIRDLKIQDAKNRTTLRGNMTAKQSSTFQDGSVEFGLIISSKSIAQLVVNPFIASLTTKYGYDKPLFAGFVIVFFSTMLMAIGTNYLSLLFGRLIQGVGSSFLNVAGLAALASRYSSPNERDEAVTYALGGLSFGLLLGAPYGGVVYTIGGKIMTFLIMCGFVFIFGCMQLITMSNHSPHIDSEEINPGNVCRLLSDPYVIFTTGIIFFEHITMAFIQTGLPIWMLDSMNTTVWQLGLVFLPSDIFYLLAVGIYPRMMDRLGRWMTAMVGILLMAVALILVPSAASFVYLLIPTGIFGIANGMVETSLMAELANLVDIRHCAMYGIVYAVADFVMCLGLSTGPIICGILMEHIHFGILLYSIAIVKLILAPFLSILKHPPSFVIENKPLLTNFEEFKKTVE